MGVVGSGAEEGEDGQTPPPRPQDKSGGLRCERGCGRSEGHTHACHHVLRVRVDAEYVILLGETGCAVASWSQAWGSGVKRVPFTCAMEQ